MFGCCCGDLAAGFRHFWLSLLAAETGECSACLLVGGVRCVDASSRVGGFWRKGCSHFGPSHLAAEPGCGSDCPLCDGCRYAVPCRGVVGFGSRAVAILAQAIWRPSLATDPIAQCAMVVDMRSLVGVDQGL